VPVLVAATIQEEQLSGYSELADLMAEWSATAPLRCPVQLTPGMVVRAKVRTAPARPAGTSWAVALPGAGWEEHDEQAIWQEIDD
jgi:hypothetical protein